MQCSAIFCYFHAECMEIIGLKAQGTYSASIWIMGEPQNPDFYDFWILGRVPEHPNQISETPGYLTKITKKPWNIFKKQILSNLWESPF